MSLVSKLERLWAKIVTTENACDMAEYQANVDYLLTLSPMLEQMRKNIEHYRFPLLAIEKIYEEVNIILEKAQAHDLGANEIASLKDAKKNVIRILNTPY